MLRGLPRNFNHEAGGGTGGDFSRGEKAPRATFLVPLPKADEGDPKVPPGTLKRTFETMNFLKRGFKAAKSAVNAIFGVRARHP